jgi:hypothetical protein
MIENNSKNESKNELTQEVVSYLWKQINKIHPSAFDGWFGMGVEEWIEFGVTDEDTPEIAYQKVRDGIEAKIEAKAYGWYSCDCGAIDCTFIYPQLTQVPSYDKPYDFDQKWNCTAHEDNRELEGEEFQEMPTIIQNGGVKQ